MKATLEFNLPEDDYDFKTAINGWKWKMVMHDLDQWIRGENKGGNGVDGYQVRDKINELLSENNLDLWNE